MSGSENKDLLKVVCEDPLKMYASRSKLAVGTNE